MPGGSTPSERTEPGRCWRTPDGNRLVEGAAQTDVYGLNPPCALVEGAHDYTLLKPETNEVLASWVGSAVTTPPYGDTEAVTRHRVEEDALVEYVFDYVEDSCWGIGKIRGHRCRRLIEGLVPI